MAKTRPKPAYIDFSSLDINTISTQIRDTETSPDIIRRQFRRAVRHSPEATYAYTQGLLATQSSTGQFVSEGTEIFAEAAKAQPEIRQEMFRAVLENTGSAGSLFVIQNISGLKRPKARACMKDLLASGGQLSDVTHWLQLAGHVLRKHNIKPSGTAGAVVDAIGDAAEWVVDTIEDGVDAILEGIDAIIDAVTDAGAALVDLLEDVASWTADQMGDLLAALFEAGRALGEFISGTFRWAYSAVSSFVKAAFSLGISIAELLGNVVAETYWVLRRFVNGIIENLGPIGEILDFVLDKIENATSALWRSTLLALRYAEATLTEVLDWMAEQSQMVFTAIINAWESIGENLLDLYEWALAAGGAVWDAIGQATQVIGNSIYYVYNFLATSGVEFLFDFTRGLLRAGRAVADLIGWAVDQAVEICGEVMRAALDMGVTLATLLVEIATDPGNALQTFIQSALDIGQTLEDLFQAVIVDTAEEFLAKTAATLLELGEVVLDMCAAALRLGGAVLAVLIATLFNLLGTFRGLRPEEEADARLVFGNSLDYQLIFLSTEDPLNEIIFGVQDFFTGEEDSRAFVTMNLINFDVDDGEIDRPTLIHELTHVWQSREVGGIYMGEAILAQAGEGYNYGYDDFAVADDDALDIQDRYDGDTTSYTDLGGIMGEGGEVALVAAAGDFEAFNREQQGQILMHWFVRSQLEIRNVDGDLQSPDFSAWEPYRQVVMNA